MSITTIAAQAPAAQATVAQRPNDFVPSKAAQAKPAQEASVTTSSAEQKQQLEAAVKAVAQFAKPMAGNLEFSLDDETLKKIPRIACEIHEGPGIPYTCQEFLQYMERKNFAVEVYDQRQMGSMLVCMAWLINKAG